MRFKGFYERWEWKRLRDLVIKQDGPECVFCGSDQEPNVDHKLPVSSYPELALTRSNLQVLCGPCNMRKGAHVTLAKAGSAKPNPKEPTTHAEGLSVLRRVLSLKSGTKQIKTHNGVRELFVANHAMPSRETMLIPGARKHMARLEGGTAKGVSFPMETLKLVSDDQNEPAAPFSLIE